MELTIPLNPEAQIEARIRRVADELYKSQPGRFPAVDQVRQLAKVSMNEACRVMKRWRAEQFSSQEGSALQQAIQQLQRAMQEENDQLAAERLALDELQQAMANDNAQLAGQVEALLAQDIVQRQELESFAQQLQALQAEQQEWQAHKEALQSECQHQQTLVQISHQEGQQWRERVSILEAELTQARQHQAAAGQQISSLLEQATQLQLQKAMLDGELGQRQQSET